MIITEEREQSLLGQFLPCSYRDLVVRFESWRDVLCEPYQHMDVKEWRYLEFDFSKGKKHAVYYELARAISYGWVEKDNISKIARYMATSSNLTGNKIVKTKVKTIRQGIYRQMKYFDKIRLERKRQRSS